MPDHVQRLREESLALQMQAQQAIDEYRKLSLIDSTQGR